MKYNAKKSNSAFISPGLSLTSSVQLSEPAGSSWGQEASLALACAYRKQAIATPGLMAQQKWNSLYFKIWNGKVIYIHIHFEIKEVTGFTVSSLS